MRTSRMLIAACVARLCSIQMPIILGTVASLDTGVLASAQEEPQDSTDADLVKELADETRAIAERMRALRIACESAQGADVDSMVAAMRQILHRLRDPRTTGLPEYYAAPSLLRLFFEECFAALSRKARDQEVLLSFAAEVATDRQLRLENLKVLACLRIADNLSPLPARQRYMLQVVKAFKDEMAPEAFVPLITADILDQLREIAFATTTKDEPYNRAAIDLLAEYGDLPAAIRLREIARTRNTMNEWSKPPGPIWRIEAQHNTQMLLDYVASGEWTDYVSRSWAVRKAVKLGVAPEEIRTAVISHSTKVGEHPGLKGEMGYLKMEALSNKVLRSDDLPAVHLPSTRPGLWSILTTQPTSWPTTRATTQKGDSQ